MIFTHKIKTRKGFTLIELLFAIAIFSIAIGSAVSILSVTLKSQRTALATQTILDQTSYALEYFSRVIRGSQAGTLNITKSGKGVSFINNKIQQEIFVDGGQLKQSTITANGTTETLNLTSADLQITSANFFKGGNDSPPTITIALYIKSNELRPQDVTEIRIQTTISQRNFSSDGSVPPPPPPPPTACDGLSGYAETSGCNDVCTGCSEGMCTVMPYGTQDIWGSNQCTASGYACNNGICSQY